MIKPSWCYSSIHPLWQAWVPVWELVNTELTSCLEDPRDFQKAHQGFSGRPLSSPGLAQYRTKGFLAQQVLRGNKGPTSSKRREDSFEKEHGRAEESEMRITYSQVRRTPFSTWMFQLWDMVIGSKIPPFKGSLQTTMCYRDSKMLSVHLLKDPVRYVGKNYPALWVIFPSNDPHPAPRLQTPIILVVFGAEPSSTLKSVSPQCK